jgi:pyruvate ferredoxin oxidoreductase gamma subunit
LALFGAERRGAPVISFTRLSTESIDQRGHIDQPNLVVVMDDSLLTEAAAQVFHGVSDQTPVLVNADPDRLEVNFKKLPSAKFTWVDLTAIARKCIGNAFVSAAAAAVAAKCIAAVRRTALEEAVRTEIAEFGLPIELIEKNLAAALEAYEQTPAIDLAVRPVPTGDLATLLATPPYLASSQFAGPTIRHRGSAALRATGNWRTERPEIDLAKCKRCFLCYLYCPEAAMRLDAENFPHVDYDHCKGCMICYEECPTDAISKRLEV